MLECEKKARPKTKRKSLYDSVLDFFGHFVSRNKKNLSLLEKKRAKGKLKMSLDWITGDDDEENTPKPQPDLKIGTSVTVIKEENISHNSSPSVLVDAVTIDSLPVHDLTTESPFLSERQNATVNGTQGTFIGFEGEKKAHQLGNSTGKGL